MIADIEASGGGWTYFEGEWCAEEGDYVESIRSAEVVRAIGGDDPARWLVARMELAGTAFLMYSLDWSAGTDRRGSPCIVWATGDTLAEVVRAAGIAPEVLAERARMKRLDAAGQGSLFGGNR